MTRRWVIRGAAVLLVASSVAAGAYVIHGRGLGQSEPVTESWADLGGQRWLRGNLRGAKLVLPDRPTGPDEANLARGGSTKIGRTRSYRLSTNSQHLRGGEIGPKPAGTRRIVALGESVTHGWGVADDETYPAQLEGELRRRGHAVEVINAGVPSIGTDTMAAWCTAKAPALAIDLVLWTRRPQMSDPASLQHYADQALGCARGLGAQLVVVLPPISQFDPHGNAVYLSEGQGLRQAFGHAGTRVVELTDIFRAAQRGHGETLERRGDKYAVVDQETGKVWLEAPVTQQGLDPSIYALFEREPSVREALLFDDGHPDAEGFVVFARAVADVVEGML